MGPYPLRSETPTFMAAASRVITLSCMATPDQAQLATRRKELRERYLLAEDERPPSIGRGVHHLALICSDPETTIRFYQETVGFPLVELFENRDYAGSSHFFFDIGAGNLLGFFDFPGLGLEPVPEGLGGVQHVAISVTPDVFEDAKRRLASARIDFRGPDLGVEESIYFKDPDNIQVELIRQPLFEMPESAPADE
jgi:glyoxylase I family protein